MGGLADWLRSLGGLEEQPPEPEEFPFGFGEEERATYREARPFTMTDKRRVLSLISAVRYLVDQEIAGEMVECGVWRGGSVMVVARTLLNRADAGRHLYLFDTFEGMPSPGEEDVANVDWLDAQAVCESGRCRADLAEVERNVGSVGYPADRVHYVRGKVEDTLPDAAPERIALLRLDTDWYASTRHEMQTLYPRLVTGGVLLVDDYLFWRGSRMAVDEYLAENGVRLFLNPIDGGGVIGVKQG